MQTIIVNKNEREYIRNLASRADETVHFLSNDMKPVRERSVCATFLRCLGMDFSVDEIVSVENKNQPPDVIFREARFEICEILDKGRRRHQEARMRAKHLKQVKTVEDIFVKFEFRSPISYVQMFDLAVKVLADKSLLYGAENCTKLDALLCVQLQRKSLYVKSFIPDHAALLSQGWRSVSLLMIPYSHVIYATESAPEFLRINIGQPRKEWNDSDTFFKL